MALEKDLNVPPYFDDYDPEKNYYRVLYRPTVAVQARELTQQQTILQSQIERFGNHVFKDGSIVDGVGIIYYPNVHFIAVDDFFSFANGLISDIYPTTLTSNTEETYLVTNSTESNSAVRATIRIAKDGTKENANNTFRETNRFYLDYTFTGTDLDGDDVNRFAPGDTLYFYNSNQNKFGTLDANNLTYTINALSSNSVFDADGNAYLIGCTDGTIYQKGFFSLVNRQVITVRDFSTNVDSYVVGFDTTETIVDENQDESLLDNALGYPNENAPGAHRLKLTPTLVSKLNTDTSNNKNFFAIVEFDNGFPTQQKDDPFYNVLNEQLARKTYEESGDYVVNPFQVESILDENDSQQFRYRISPGIGYVRGNRIEKVGTSKVTVQKATITEVAENQIITANYGNYVICNEYLGQFDFKKLSEISLYDQPQKSISEYEGITTIPSGSVVGYANIRAVVHEDGTKGSPNARYYLYLFNIRMNSGKNFSTDVKSMYMDGTFGKAKADIILENGIAVIKESTKTQSYFDTGLSAIKRLTNNTGIGDTSFIYNQIKQATLATDGTISVTIDTAYAGASSERLNSTTGSTLTGNSLDDYNICISSSTYTANLTSTVAVTSGTKTITGSGTNFTTELEANCNIRIYANTTQTYIRRVVSIANNTSLTIDTALPFSNGTSNYQRFFVAGSPLPIQSISITSNTTFTANVNIPTASFDSATTPQTVYCSYPVNRNQAISIPKIINKSRYVKINCSNNTTTTTGPWDLGLVDVHKIKNIYVGTTYANTNAERSTWFELDTGQRDSFYDHGRLIVKPEYSSEITSSTRILVELDVFTANSSASIGFFSVESYPIDDANTANTTAIQTIEIPTYQNVSLRNVIDFRPVKYNTANVNATAIGDATENPATSNTSFNVSASGQHFIAPDSNFTADIENYLPRIDLVTLDPNGVFTVKQGQPSTLPRAPFVDGDRSIIAECYVPAYPTPTRKDFELYGPNIDYIRINLKTNKRYTMKDVGTLEDRIRRLEYYTVLNALEQQAKDLTIPDANGLDRFKNGIFADPFNSHGLGNVSDIEYKISIDKDETVARPIFDVHDVDFRYISSNSTNVQMTGPILTLPYNEVVAIGQRYATKVRNTTEALWQWNGRVKLYPSYDFYRDSKEAPNVNVNLDLSTAWEKYANMPWDKLGLQNPFSAIYGDWRNVKNLSVTSESVVDGYITTTTTTTETLQQQIVKQMKINSINEEINLGSYVKDITVQPYMRSRIVAFVATNMKPNTTLHAFFDDINVDEYCVQGNLNEDDFPIIPGVPIAVAEGQEDLVVKQQVGFNWGEGLTSDANGFVCGLFRIPEAQFRTGDRVFQLTNVDDLVIGASAQITTSKATFTADNIAVTKGSTTINIRQPEFNYTETVKERTIQSISVDVVDNTPQQTYIHDDPIAQSFYVEPPEYIPGVFMTGVGVYFKSKDQNLGCSVYLCEMENNMPDTRRILASSYLESSAISTSNNASLETKFNFDYPVYLLRNQYAFFVQPDGNSPEYLIWTAETGGYDVSSNTQIFSNPYTGLMFISANRDTWTAFQKEDLKFNIYRPNFTSNTGTAIFKNDDDEFLTVDGFTKANSSTRLEIGDTVFTVNTTSVDVANINSIIANTLVTNFVSGRIQYFDEANGTLWLDSSTANSTTYFSNTTNKTIAIYRPQDASNTSHINVSTLVAYANIVTVNNLKYHAVVPKFGILEPTRTSLSFSFKGTSNSNTFDTKYQNVINELDYQFIDNERHIVSRSNEITSLSSNKSSEFKIELSTENSLISPVINLSRKVMMFVQNIINDDNTDEHTRYGNAASKYISKKVVLADGQEAESLNIYLTAYRPVETNVEVYAKFLNNEDPQPFDDKVWTKLQYANNSNFIYSSQTNTSDFKEYLFTVPIVNSVPYAAFANSGFDIYNPFPGGISIESSNTAISAKKHNFNANTQVNNTNDTITITDANTYFRVGDQVLYSVDSGNTAITGLISGISYFISYANASHIALSQTRDGANVDIGASTTSETGHNITGTFFLEDITVGQLIRIEADDYFAIRTVTSIANNTYLTVDKGLEQTNTAAVYYIYPDSPDDGIVEYTNSEGSRFVGFKEFAIKIVLLSNNAVRVPKLQDVRAIALQM
jgi:hypothetical protein